MKIILLTVTLDVRVEFYTMIAAVRDRDTDYK